MKAIALFLFFLSFNVSDGEFVVVKINASWQSLCSTMEQNTLSNSAFLKGISQDFNHAIHLMTLWKQEHSCFHKQENSLEHNCVVSLVMLHSTERLLDLY